MTAALTVQPQRACTQDLMGCDGMPYNDALRPAGRVLCLVCADLNVGCDTVLQAETRDEILQQYVRHSLRCMHRNGPAELDRLLTAITFA